MDQLCGVVSPSREQLRRRFRGGGVTTITSTNTLFSNQITQHLGHDNGTIGLLVVFQDRDHGSADGNRRAVQRVDEMRPFFALGLVSGYSIVVPGSRCN